MRLCPPCSTAIAVQWGQWHWQWSVVGVVSGLKPASQHSWSCAFYKRTPGRLHLGRAPLGSDSVCRITNLFLGGTQGLGGRQSFLRPPSFLDAGRASGLGDPNSLGDLRVHPPQPVPEWPPQPPIRRLQRSLWVGREETRHLFRDSHSHSSHLRNNLPLAGSQGSALATSQQETHTHTTHAKTPEPLLWAYI